MENPEMMQKMKDKMKQKPGNRKNQNSNRKKYSNTYIEKLTPKSEEEGYLKTFVSG